MIICNKRTENHNFTITTNTSQHVEFFHSLIFIIITSRNEVVAKVTFLHLSAILFTGGGCLPQCMLGYHPPGSRHPQSRHPPGADPPEQTPLGADTPQGQTPPRSRPPPEQTPPGSRHPLEQTPPQEADSDIQSMSGRYASYWNAFLFCINFNMAVPRYKENNLSLLSEDRLV